MAAPLLDWPFLYTAGHFVCHQIPARTFQTASGPLAVCARCLGLYLGGAAGSVLALAFGGRRTATTARARRLIVVAALPTVLTVTGEWVFRWPIANVVRFATALPLGAAAAWLVVRALEVDWRA